MLNKFAPKAGISSLTQTNEILKRSCPLSPCRRESSYVKSLWIPAGVYPDENRGRNDIFRGSSNKLSLRGMPDFAPQGGASRRQAKRFHA